MVRLRKRAGMNQSQLAKASKLGMMNLIQIETGQRQPTASMRADLARALRVESL
nr:helix-turn-helix transcriptional regulator [Motiliproteus sediminis]